MFRARAAETEHALTATYELLEQSMEDMLHPRVLPSLNPTRNEGRTVAGRDQARHQSVDFIRMWLLRNNSPQPRADPAEDVGSGMSGHRFGCEFHARVDAIPDGEWYVTDS